MIFSEGGEDVIVLDLLKRVPPSERGIYVDAGAFDPILLSNTMLLHKHGWRGINIDANPKTIERFEQERPEDKNISCALSDREETFQYLEYAGGTCNRIGACGDMDESSMCGDQPVRKTNIEAKTLDLLLSQAFLNPPIIDFLSIDCEGHDFRVLKGLDFGRYRPRVICIESTWLESGEGEVPGYLMKLGYKIHAKMPNNIIFADIGFFQTLV